jgi:hypothetical protein
VYSDRRLYTDACSSVACFGRKERKVRGRCGFEGTGGTHAAWCRGLANGSDRMCHAGLGFALGIWAGIVGMGSEMTRSMGSAGRDNPDPLKSNLPSGLNEKKNNNLEAYDRWEHI